jgi:hypothetical protein
MRFLRASSVFLTGVDGFEVRFEQREFLARKARQNAV